MEAMPSESSDLLTLARSRVRTGAIPDWVTANNYDREFTAKARKPVTPLLLERQTHAERRELYVRHALRLESVLAMQHHSQWRMEFAPKTDWVVLHSVKTRRGAVEREHLSLGAVQFLQREAGLEGFIIDGGITLLLLLEDVAVGDVLEYSYTIRSEPELLPKHWGILFDLPLASEIGKHYFSVRHAPGRPMKWKSSAQSLAPVTNRRRENEEEEIELVWQGENVVTLDPEEGTPLSEILYPWMQFSDCADWQTVARAVVEAWPADIQGDGLKKLLDEIKSASPELLGQVGQAIKIIQGGFRYLSVNVELGACIPADPETVIRRRYGDCKDLALLLSRLLRGLGVSARPVLVHAGLRNFIATLLPSPSFNHAIVEFEIGQERRWIDATMKFQGGGALDRCVSDFGCGLPVDANATELVSVPKASLPSGSYEVKDSFLLDTAGRPSYLGVQITAKGFHADQLRGDFETAGAAAISKNRLQAYANRFYRAARAGEMQWRDDRERNEFVIAEVFEIDGFLQKDANSCFFEIRSQATAALLAPPQIVRRDSFGLPFPCHQTHIVEIDFQGLNLVKIHPYESDSKFFRLTREVKSLPKYLKATFTLTTLENVVPANASTNHRKQVETAWRASGFRLQLPLGYGRMRKRDSFGALPTTGQGTVSNTKVASAVAENATPATVYVPDHLAAGTKAEAVAQVATPDKRVENRFADPRLPPVTLRKEGKSGAKHSGSARHSHDRYNVKCALSLGLAFVAVWLFVIGVAAAGSHQTLLGGILGLLTFPTVLSAVALAVLGLRESKKNPRKANGQGMAVATLWLSGALGIFLVPILIAGIDNAVRMRDRMTRARLLKFPAERFVFHTPEKPWVQVDSRKFGHLAVVGFAEPGTISAVVLATNLGPTVADSRSGLVTWFKDGERRANNPWRVLDEGVVQRNGLTGWQYESLGYFQGHEVYSINWILTTNGFGYMLRASSSSELRDRTKKDAEYIFSRFEPISASESQP